MNRGCKYGIGLTGVILLLFIANLLIGSVNIPPAEGTNSLAVRRCPGRVRAHAADGFQESAGRPLHSGY